MHSCSLSSLLSRSLLPYILVHSLSLHLYSNTITVFVFHCSISISIQNYSYCSWFVFSSLVSRKRFKSNSKCLLTYRYLLMHNHTWTLRRCFALIFIRSTPSGICYEYHYNDIRYARVYSVTIATYNNSIALAFLCLIYPYPKALSLNAWMDTHIVLKPMAVWTNVAQILLYLFIVFAFYWIISIFICTNSCCLLYGCFWLPLNKQHYHWYLLNFSTYNDCSN